MNRKTIKSGISVIKISLITIVSIAVLYGIVKIIGLTVSSGQENYDKCTPYPHGNEPIGSVREIYDGVLTPEMAVNTFRNIDRLFATRNIKASSDPYPLPLSVEQITEVNFNDKGKDYTIEDFITLNRVAALLIIKDDSIKLERYMFGNTECTHWMSMSVAKSVTSTLIGAAVQDGYISSINDQVTKYVPVLKGSGYDGVTVRDVLMMSSGVKWTEAYSDSTSDRRHLLEAQISQVPGSAMEVMKNLPKVAKPGTLNNYNTGETQVAAEIIRGAVGKPLATYLSERIWSKFGMERDANWWLESPDGIEIGGSGISATLRDFGRFGLFILNGGMADGEKILPDGWIQEATTPKELKDGTPLDYGYLWWTGITPDSRRDEAFMARGIHGQFIYINPVAKIVVAGWGAQPTPKKGRIISNWSFCDAVTEVLGN